MIETLSPQGPDQALDEGILPGTARRGHHFLGAKTLQQTTEVGSVAAVAIAQEIRRRGVVGKGFPDLLSCPRRGRMVGDIDMNDATAIVREDDEGRTGRGKLPWGR